MKQLLLICAVVMGESVLAADKKPLTKEESAKVIEAAIRKELRKPAGELTKADLEKVTHLSLYNNQLTDVIGLEKLTKLKALELAGNQLTDEGLKEVAKLQKLGSLSLHFTQITEVPKGLEKLTQLKRLHLGKNQLTDVKGLEKLPQLTYLNLSENQLTDVRGLEKLTQLTVMGLSGNKLIEVPNELEKLTQLVRLYLTNNQLTEVPKGLEKLTKLDLLHLGKNQLTDVKGLEKLTQLESLNLEDNPDLAKAQIDELKKALPNCKIFSNPTLNKEEQREFIEAAVRKAAKKPTGDLTKADYEKVTVLSFVASGLTEVPKGIEKLTHLTNLNLNHNQLTNVKGLEKLTQLKGLYLGGNKLTELPKGLENLEKLTQLRDLELSINQLTNVTGLENLTQLRTLRLVDNPALTKAQIDQLQKALPNCKIYSNPKK